MISFGLSLVTSSSQRNRRASLSRGATDTMRKTFSISAREPPCAIETWSRHLLFLAAGIDLCTYIHSGMGFDWPLPKHHRQVDALLYFCHVWSQDDEAGNGSSLLKMDYWCWLAQLCPSEVDPLLIHHIHWWFLLILEPVHRGGRVISGPRPVLAHYQY